MNIWTYHSKTSQIKFEESRLKCRFLSLTNEVIRQGTIFHMFKENHCCYSVAKLHLILCNSTDCSTPGFPVLHHLKENNNPEFYT